MKKSTFEPGQIVLNTYTGLKGVVMYSVGKDGPFRVILSQNKKRGEFVECVTVHESWLTHITEKRGKK